MANILFIALEFAPVQQTGAFRSIKFVKHLPSYGVHPVVLTVDPQDATRIFKAPLNQGLVEDIGYQPPTYYMKDEKPIAQNESRLRRFIRLRLRTNDGFFRRFQKSLKEQLRIIQNQHELTAIYVSLPPFGAGRLALEASRITGLPIIVDMRDAWSQWASSPFPSYLHYRSALRQERELLSSAKAVITVTDELSKMFQRSHPDIPEDRFKVITNGIDTELPKELPCSWGDNSEKFKVAYLGSYYYDPVTDADRHKRWYQRKPNRWLSYLPVEQHWIYRTPYFFFQALARLQESDPEVASRFEFHQIGNAPSWLTGMAEQLGVADQVVSHGVVPRAEVDGLLQKMDACLVTSVKVTGGDDFCLASKTFDYIQARKLLLGFVSQGSQRRFLEKVEGSVICDADEIAPNAQKLKILTKRSEAYAFQVPVLQQYRRGVLAEKLARLVDSCDS